MLKIEVKGIRLDNGKKKNEIDLILQIPKDRLNDMDINDTDDIENFIENEISNQTGYCHFGWKSYEVLKQESVL